MTRGLVAMVVTALAACTQTRAEESPRVPTAAAPRGQDAAFPTGAAPAVAAPAAGAAAVPDVASCVAGAPYDVKALRERIAFLASEELGGRAPGSDGDKAARAHIVEAFECLGLTAAGTSGYEQAFELGSRQTANVIAFVAGSDPDVGGEIIAITAHHDHLGDGHLGANDNASGVAALLAIAQWVKQQAAAPRRTIAFMVFGAEEDGMVGSQFYVKHPVEQLPLAKIVQVINLDMVGSHDSRGFVAAMGTFRGMPSRTLLATLDDRYPRIHVGMGGRARGSDYEPFCDIGIPYVFFWTPDKRCYHRRCDTVEKLDLPELADIAALAGDLAWALAATETDLSASRAKLRCYGKKK